MARDLELAIETAEADPAVRAFVITGTGRAFCAGADLAALNAYGGSIMEPLEHFLAELGRVLRRIELSRLPVWPSARRWRLDPPSPQDRTGARDLPHDDG